MNEQATNTATAITCGYLLVTSVCILCLFQINLGSYLAGLLIGSPLAYFGVLMSETMKIIIGA